ncbi:hypothetical protein GCM10010988_05720 [Cnuibacter physcomitrellae]|nr:hypothetical protein GCM10010988_05720 [Cnuibacter physcomitrellae]
MITRTISTARSGALRVSLLGSGEPAPSVTLDDRKTVFVFAPDEARSVALRLIEAARAAELRAANPEIREV